MFKRLEPLVLNYWHLLILTVVFGVSSYALFQPHLFHVHDYVHGARIAQMSLALKDGHFPVIWTKDFGFGYGMPLFEFYAPLPYYVGSMFYLLGFSLTNAVKSLFLMTNFFSLVGAYFLGKALFKNKLSGVLLATTFTLASYRGLNLFVRGAISESWGMMTYPWILLASYWVIKRVRWSWFLLALSLTTLFLSHNLSTVMFLPFVAVWTLGVWCLQLWRAGRFRQLNLKQLVMSERSIILEFMAGFSFAFGLSAFYLLPAFLEKGLTQMEQIIIGGYFNYRLHFIYLRQLLQDNWGYGGSTWGPGDDISFFLGWGQWLGLVCLSGTLLFWFGLFLRQRLSGQKRTRTRFKFTFELFTAFLALFLTGLATLFATEKTLFVWQNLDFFKYIQFPWRYLSVTVMFLSLAVAVLPLLSKLVAKRWWRHLVLVATGIVILTTLITSTSYFKPEFYLADDQALYYADRTRIAAEMSGILPDYVPAQFNLKLKPSKNLVVFGPDWLFQASDNPRLKLLVNKTQASLVEVNSASEPLKLTLARAYYPGWQAEIDGEPVPILVSDDGLIQVDVPRGNHQVGVYLGETSIRLISQWISLASLVLLIGVVRWLYLENGQQKIRHRTQSKK